MIIMKEVIFKRHFIKLLMGVHINAEIIKL